MERRRFLETCAALGGGLAAWPAAWADVEPRRYSRARLVDVHGQPVKARSLAPDTNYVFHYPYAATPCFLLNLREPVRSPATLRRQDGSRYTWDGGVGPDRAIVSFSAICAHKLAYPTKDVSFIRYQRDRSATSDARVIHCCADHSVYDPAGGARVLAGPAPQPLAAILLDYDAAADELAAIGTVGYEQFDAFFRKYDFKLALDYGGVQRAREPVAGQAVVRELAEFCRNAISC
jgi:arsenite oxidase small subunit